MLFCIECLGCHHTQQRDHHLETMLYLLPRPLTNRSNLQTKQQNQKYVKNAFQRQRCITVVRSFQRITLDPCNVSKLLTCRNIHV
jgi:hypothetical protein